MNGLARRRMKRKIYSIVASKGRINMKGKGKMARNISTFIKEGKKDQI